MTNNPLEELQKLFEAAIEMTSTADYLRFIKKTPILSNIAESIISFPGNSMALKNAKVLYEYFALDKPYDKSKIFLISTSSHSGLSVFHNRMIEEAKKIEPALNGKNENKRKKRLITKDGRGIFWYDKEEIKMSKDKIFYQVFDAIFTNASQEGFVSYEDIEKHLVKQCNHPRKEDEAKRNKRIYNALSDTQGLFKYARINKKPLKNKTLDGRELIKNVRGKGIIFYNPGV